MDGRPTPPTQRRRGVGSDADWRPCLRLPDGRWRLAGHVSAGSAAAYWRAPGRFGNIGLRYRLTAGGPWSPVSADRKEIDIVAVSPDEQPPAARAGDWSVPVPFALAGGGRCGAFVLGGAAGAAVAVQWTAAPAPAEADWRDAVALADGRWHLGQAVAGNLVGIAVRWRLAAAGPWSAASQDRKPLSFPDLPIVPVLLAAPALAGSGRIGEAVAALPGIWTGAPAVGFEWCRDGAAIPGATAASYRPGAADDRTALSCRITATTAVGSRRGDHRRAGGDLRRPRGGGGGARRGDPRPGAGIWTVAAAPAFRGGGLRFAVSWRRRDRRRADRGDLDSDRGRARRHGHRHRDQLGRRRLARLRRHHRGRGDRRAAGARGRRLVDPGDRSSSPAGRYAGVVEAAAAGPAANAVALEWSDAAAPAGAGLPLTALGGRRWRMDDPSGAGRNAVAAGASKSGIAVRYRLAADGLWSDWSEDRKGFSMPAPAAYWRPIERTPGAAISAPNNYGFGVNTCAA